jgi:hypothetical protein
MVPTESIVEASTLDKTLFHSQAQSLTRRRMEDPVELHVMPPPIARPKFRDIVQLDPERIDRKRKVRVLDEEIYQDTMGRIIERDFFPELAWERKQVDGESGIERDMDEHESLDAFLAANTSEDNASFEEIINKDKKERRRRLHWLYEANDGRREGMLGLYYLGGGVLSAEERERMDQLLETNPRIGDDRQNGADSWRFRVRNQLMFPPELDDSLDTCHPALGDGPAQRPALPSTGRLLIANKAKSSTITVDSRLQNKTIQHRNTRLIGEPVLAHPASPLERPHSPSEYSQADSLDASGFLGTTTRSYRPVAMTPLIEPGVQDSPLITWGEAASTPLVLTSDNDALRFNPLLPRQPLQSEERPCPPSKNVSPAFKIKELSSREALARSLDPVTQSKKDGDLLIARRRRTFSRKTVALTPAALSLAARIRSSNGPTTPFDSALAGSYSLDSYRRKST